MANVGPTLLIQDEGWFSLVILPVDGGPTGRGLAVRAIYFGGN